MAINKNKVMEAAQKFVEKGQLDKAIKEYSKIVEEDQKDVRVWLKLGDLYAKKGAKQEATDTYLRVAQFYSDQGFYLKAVAVYKQVLKLDPRLIEVNIRLAEVYRQLGLLSDAVQQYELVAAFYHREGKTREALSTIRELVELDPENVATRIKLAELYSKEQMAAEAIGEFAKAAEFLREHGRMDDFIKVAERLVWHQPDNHAINRELAGLYLKRHDPRHALQKLQACFKADPRDVDTLSLLAAAFLALDQKQKTVSVWKELARVYAENRQGALAVEVHRRILSLVPDDAESLAVVGGRMTMTGRSVGVPPTSVPVRPVAEAAEWGPGRPSVTARPVAASLEAAPLVTMRSSQTVPPLSAAPMPPPRATGTPVPPAPALYGRGAPVPDSDEAVAVEIDVAGETTAMNRASAEQTVEATIDAELEGDSTQVGENEEQVAKLLGEADVYIKYGIRDRALVHLGKVLDLDPKNLDAHERMKDLYLALDRKTEAALELVQLIEIVSGGGPELAQGYLAELATLDPEAAEALAERIGAPASGDDAEGSGQPMSLDSVDVILEPSSVDAAPVGAGLDGEEGTEVRDEFPAIATDASADAAAPEIEVDDDQVESSEDSQAELNFDEGGSTAGDRTYDISMEAPSVDSLKARAVETPQEVEVISLEAEPVEGDLAIDPGDDAIEESIGVELEPDENSQAGPLEDDVDEADFFVTQGLFDEARTILHDLLARHPNHPVLLAKLADVETRAANAPRTEPPKASASAATTVPAPRPSRVIAKPLGEADADTHYDLGLAYKEMGLLDEAIKEFELVRETPGRAVQCHLMIGLIHVERGKLSEAVDEWKSALYVEGISDREALALYFELGAAYEGLGDVGEAIYYFEKVNKRDPRFRNVGRRIEALSSKGAGGGAAAAARHDADGSGDEDMALDSLGEHDA